MTLRDFAYTGNSVIETIYTTGRVERSVWSSPTAKVADLRADPFNGKVSIDYAPILRTMYRGGRGPIPGCVRTYHFYDLFMNADIDRGAASTSYKFVRGVSQNDYPAEKNKFLTNMPELRHYKGFPLFISYIFNETEDNVHKSLVLLSPIGHGGQQEPTTNLIAIKKDHLTTDLTTNANGVQEVDSITVYENYQYNTYEYLDDQGPSGRQYRWGTEDAYLLTANRNPQQDNFAYQPGSSSTITIVGRTTHTATPYDFDGKLTLSVNYQQTDERPIKEYNIPQHPFYVRWINTLGGHDYFMFACDNKITNKLTANDTYTKYGSNGYKSSYHKDAQRTIEVSTGVIPRGMADCLAELIFSPRIELWDSAEETWSEIQVIDGKTEIKATQTCSEMLFTFELQTPILNK